MDLTKLGWNADLNQQFAPHHAKGLVPARVAVEGGDEIADLKVAS